MTPIEIQKKAIDLLASNSFEKENLAWTAALIDHTILKVETTKAQVQAVCEEALEYGFATVCVRLAHLKLAANLLEGSSVKPIAVVGFPTGAESTKEKVFETREALSLGAKEIDMVISIGQTKSHEWKNVFQDIAEVVLAAEKTPVKVILETCALTNEEKIAASAIVKSAGAAFVKTSTGFSTAGATVEDITLMRSIVGPVMGVKASGGIRTPKDVLTMLAAGANRIGASAGPALIGAKKADRKEGTSLY
ncbi:MAG: deoxyribose-phosphate aldolase [Oligoflexia bacterium]|nr:deoxyribose-phosphate aldolase [Oligoflexia bacterium]